MCVRLETNLQPDTPTVFFRSGLFQWLGLVDQHDRDAITDFILQATGSAVDGRSLLVQFDWPLALRAGQDVQKFFFYHHRFPCLQCLVVGCAVFPLVTLNFLTMIRAVKRLIVAHRARRVKPLMAYWGQVHTVQRSPSA